MYLLLTDCVFFLNIDEAFSSSSHPFKDIVVRDTIQSPWYLQQNIQRSRNTNRFIVAAFSIPSFQPHGVSWSIRSSIWLENWSVFLGLWRFLIALYVLQNPLGSIEWLRIFWSGFKFDRIGHPTPHKYLRQNARIKI